MPVFELGNELWFPSVDLSEDDGLLAYGGDLNTERLLFAYKAGIFPWYSPPDPILWWSPDPRFVLFPERLKVSKTMRQILRKNIFKVTYDQEFRTVMENCGLVPRKDQQGTWITDDMLDAYCDLHKKGLAHSVEVYLEDELVGGLYGICIGQCFFGESMFSKVSNASKTGFITMVTEMEKAGIRIIDCQVFTPHLESLGAEMIPRTQFLQIIHSGMNDSSVFTFKE